MRKKKFKNYKTVFVLQIAVCAVTNKALVNTSRVSNFEMAEEATLARGTSFCSWRGCILQIIFCYCTVQNIHLRDVSAMKAEGVRKQLMSSYL
jgi:hypothetical protein